MATSADLLPSRFALTVRLRNVADNEGMSIQQLAHRHDLELLRIPNIGRKTIRFLREFYPGPQIVARETMSSSPTAQTLDRLQRMEEQLQRIEQKLDEASELLKHAAGETTPN